MSKVAIGEPLPIFGHRLSGRYSRGEAVKSAAYSEFIGALRHDWFSKTRQVVVPWTSKRPLLSVTRPSAVPTRRPRLSTTPSALIGPASGVIGRTNEILNTRVVEPMPLSSVDWT